ncbi:methylmalonyl-CoA epimerase [Salsuginibacillus halophilus]|uniref:Methylmalonyl-CoA epimerase n=1 Tax=Salsuginibacillus halophilus TaxID=517424 RepID=A0A2P8HY73_9BACI|nr:methylmalonyl-CoA epimerase [Salsuginibacillus halophilus]PSL51115.1 methylmalonyl-CoA epimerase [Salsuginibacillus halophilus]
MLGEAPEKIDHLGLAVHSLQEHLPFYTDVLGLTHEKTEEVQAQGVKVAFLTIGEAKFELLEPVSAESPIAGFLNKRGEGIHHVALRVTNIEARMEEMKQAGIRTLQDQPVTGAGGALVAFLHPKDTKGVLYELCEKQDRKDVHNDDQ